jgi:hypothetical protein
MIQRTFPPSITLTSAFIGTIRPRRKPAISKRWRNSLLWSELSSALGAGLTTPTQGSALGAGLSRPRPKAPRWARVSRPRPKSMTDKSPSFGISLARTITFEAGVCGERGRPVGRVPRRGRETRAERWVAPPVEIGRPAPSADIETPRHQIRTRRSGASQSSSPSLTPNAA